MSKIFLLKVIKKHNYSDACTLVYDASTLLTILIFCV